MSVTIVYPTTGRGAWSRFGGTLSLDGTAPGPFYRAPAATSVMPGRRAFNADRDKTVVGINEYAVWRAVAAIQTVVYSVPDGRFGSQTANAVRGWQKLSGLVADGIFGPASARVMWLPLVAEATTSVEHRSMLLMKLLTGHTGYESQWDPGAVGSTTPQDLGLNQINGAAHPGLTADFRLNPITSLRWAADFINENLDVFHGVEDDAIAAYNLGRGGARAWIDAGRPDTFRGVFVRRYINQVKAAAAA